MNDVQHSAYSAYLRNLADHLLLRDWEIELKREWADTDAYAQAEPWREENHLRIRISEGFDGHPAEERREWLVHELIHAHVARAEHAVERLAELLPDHLAVQLTKKTLDDEMEILVQNLARILAPHLPLPNEGGAESSEEAA